MCIEVIMPNSQQKNSQQQYSISPFPNVALVGQLMLRLCVTGAVMLLTGFLCGLAGYYTENPAPPWGDEAAFRFDALKTALETLVLGRFGDLLSHGWLTRAAAFVLPVTLLLLWGATVWFFARNQVQRFFICRRGGHIVVEGPAEAAGLVLSWTRPTLWMVPGPVTLAQRASMPRHGVLVVGSLHDSATRRHCALQQARQILLLSNDSADNIQTGLALLDDAVQQQLQSWPCSLYLSLQTVSLTEEFERRITDRQLPRDLELHLFQPQVLGVRRLFLQHPTERMHFENNDNVVQVAIIGFGAWGSQVLRRLLLEEHPAPPWQVKITVLDRDAAHLERLFTEKHPDTAMLPDINWVSLDVQNSGALGRWLDTAVLQSPSLTSCFVCLGGGELSYTTALRLESGMRERLVQVAPIYYHRSNRSGRSASDTLFSIYPFGASDQLLEEELVLQEQRDTLARRIHENYLKSSCGAGVKAGDKPALQEWHRLPRTFRQENRSQADHHLYKLRQAGCRVRPAASPRLFVFTPELLERLAIAEHARWCASRILSGWRYAPQRDDSRRLHTDIVPYNQLSEQVKEYDRDAIRNLPHLFAGLGLEIVQDLLIEPELVSAVVEETGAAALQSVAAQYPDRFPVLLVRLDDPAQRLLGCGWNRAGGIIRVLVEEPLYLLLDRADVEERQELAWLADAAESMLVLSDQSPPTASVCLSFSCGIPQITPQPPQTGAVADAC